MCRLLTRAAAYALLCVPAALTFAQRPWSDPAGWPSGRLPAAGDRVEIAAGDEVVLDVSPPALRSLTVAGTLRFAERDLTLRAGWILVDGLLEVGTAAAPFAHRATIEVDGPVEEAQGMGGRFLAVGTGSLELHGASAAKRSWTQLAATAEAGATRLTLAEATGWVVGDELGIAPSGYDAFAVDRVTVTAVSGRAVTVSPALEHTHFGEILEYGGKDIDCRAEVALLSREVIIQGPASAEDERYGGHVMVMGSAGPVHVEGVGLRRLGQPGRDARYSFHWHLAGDRAGDYVRRSSVVGALQRGIVAHGTQNVEVADNVVFDVHNHAYIPAEDGNETGNRFTGNLAVLVQNPPRAEFAFPRDNLGGSNQGEHRSSGFWLRNFDNVLVNNHVGGVEAGMGFFYDSAFRDGPFRSVENDLATPITFTGNVAHSMRVSQSNSNSGSNVAMYGAVGHGMGMFVGNFRLSEEQEGLLRFTDFTAYKCDMSGIWSEIHRATFEDLALADNATALLTGPSQVHDAVVVGRSRNPVRDENRILMFGHDRAGYYSIAQGGKKRPKISSVRFFDMHVGKDAEAAGFILDHSLDFKDNYVRDIHLDNSRPIWLEPRGPVEGRPPGVGLFDADGSLTGSGTPAMLFFPNSPLVRDDCAWHPEWNAYVCPSDEYADMQLVWSNSRSPVRLVQANGTVAYGLGSGAPHVRLHLGEEAEVLIDDPSPEQHSFSVKLSPVADSRGGPTRLRLPYPFPGLTMATSDGATVPRLASEAAVRAFDGAAYAFDPVDGEIYLQAIVPPSDVLYYDVRPGDQAVTTSTTSTIDLGVRDLSVYPNPYGPATELRVRVVDGGKYALTLTDVTGRPVAEVFAGTLAPGSHALPVALPTLPSGVYHLSFAGESGQRTLPLHIQ